VNEGNNLQGAEQLHYLKKKRLFWRSLQKRGPPLFLKAATQLLKLE